MSALLLAGCAGAPATSASPEPTASSASADPSALVTPATTSASASPTSSVSEAPTPGVRAVTITLADGKASPNGDRIELSKGEPFVLDITSDRDDEVHIHGIDKEIEISAGDHKKVELSIDQTGRFEVESHHPELLIVVLQVR